LQFLSRPAVARADGVFARPSKFVMKRSRGLTDPVYRANKGKMSSKIRFNLIGTA